MDAMLATITSVLPWEFNVSNYTQPHNVFDGVLRSVRLLSDQCLFLNVTQNTNWYYKHTFWQYQRLSRILIRRYEIEHHSIKSSCGMPSLAQGFPKRGEIILSANSFSTFPTLVIIRSTCLRVQLLKLRRCICSCLAQIFIRKFYHNPLRTQNGSWK